VVHGDPPDVYIAQDEYVLTRLLAVHVVASTDPGGVPAASLTRIRTALLEDRWPDAVGEWIEAMNTPIDVHADVAIWTEPDLDLERASLEMRVARIFGDAT
jgi:hypothetical protein